MTKQPSPLAPEQLYTACNAAALGFASSAELPDLPPTRIHGRAVEALRLGLDMPHAGYNLFVLGEPGSGRHAITQELLQHERHHGPPPADWCYVYNFKEPTRPNLLRLPCGRGTQLREDMARFVEALTPAINAVFQSDAYRERIEALQKEAKLREASALKALGDEAAQQHIALVRTPAGLIFVPLKDDGEPMGQEDFQRLPEAQQKELAARLENLHERLHRLTAEFPRWHQETLNRMKAVGSEALRSTVTHLVDDLKPHWADLPEVTEYLNQVLADIVESGEQLRASTHSEGDTETTT